MSDGGGAPAAGAAAEKKVALITGTNSGVGLALTVMMAKAGYTVWATMRTVSKATDLNEAAAAAGVAELITVDECDVSNTDSVNASVERLLAAHGRIDVLVNNAGFSVFGSVEFLEEDLMHRQFETNFFGVIRTQRAVLPTMRAQRSGKIINVSSIGGVWGQPFNDVYCASKFALEGLTESQGALFREFGIYQTNVEPGGIRTKFIANVQRPDMTKIPAEYHPYLQSTVAAYTGTDPSKSTSQSQEEVADAIMQQVVSVEQPPFRVQTNPLIQRVFEMQISDTTGEAGLAAAKGKFFPKADAGEGKATTEAKE